MIKKILTIVALTIFSYTIQAQCTKFAEAVGLPLLTDSKYVHDGYTNALLVAEGDNIDLVKPFFKGKKYKVVVIGDPASFDFIRFRVVNSSKIVIYDNLDDDYPTTWEYSPLKNENLVISVYTPSPKNHNTPKTGCLAVLIGMALN